MMRISLLASVLLALSLAACSSTPGSGASANGDASPPAPVAVSTDTAVPDAEACRAQGGELRPLGRLQRVQCVVPYADAGKTCSSKADCSGQCLARETLADGVAATGTCQRDISEKFGCRQSIDNGVTQRRLCVD